MQVFSRSSLAAVLICGGMVLSLSGNAYALVLNIVTNSSVADQTFRLASAEPHDRQVLSTTPPDITLTFTQPLRPGKANIKVLDMYSNRVDNDDAAYDGKHLSVPLPELAPGKYTVKWSAQCQCPGEVSLEDIYHFTVQ